MISSVHTTRNSAMWMYKTPSYHKMTASLRRIKNDQAKLKPLTGFGQYTAFSINRKCFIVELKLVQFQPHFLEYFLGVRHNACDEESINSLRCFLLSFLSDQRLVDVWNDTSSSDGSFDEGVQLLITSDSEL